MYTTSQKWTVTEQKPLLLTKTAFIWSKAEQKLCRKIDVWNKNCFLFSIFEYVSYSCDFEADLLVSLLQSHDPSGFYDE